MDQEMLSLILGNEEVVVLLHLFHVKTLLGLGSNPLPGMSKSQSAAALVAAEHSLRAKNILRVVEKEKKIEIDRVAIALVGSCVTSQTVFLISRQLPDGTRRVNYYYVTPQLVIEHAFPETGLQQFTAAAKVVEMFPRIDTFLNLEIQTAPSCPSAQMTQDALSQAKEQARNQNQPTVERFLHDQGIPESTGHELAETLTHWVASGSIIRINLRTEDRKITSEEGGLAILEGTNGLWAITPEGVETRLRLKVEPISAIVLRARLTALLDHSSMS